MEPGIPDQIQHLRPFHTFPKSCFDSSLLLLPKLPNQFLSSLHFLLTQELNEILCKFCEEVIKITSWV